MRKRKRKRGKSKTKKNHRNDPVAWQRGRRASNRCVIFLRIIIIIVQGIVVDRPRAVVLIERTRDNNVVDEIKRPSNDFFRTRKITRRRGHGDRFLEERVSLFYRRILEESENTHTHTSTRYYRCRGGERIPSLFYLHHCLYNYCT